jgi:hypothetical protein
MIGMAVGWKDTKQSEIGVIPSDWEVKIVVNV